MGWDTVCYAVQINPYASNYTQIWILSKQPVKSDDNKAHTTLEAFRLYRNIDTVQFPTNNTPCPFPSPIAFYSSALSTAARPSIVAFVPVARRRPHKSP